MIQKHHFFALCIILTLLISGCISGNGATDTTTPAPTTGTPNTTTSPPTTTSYPVSTSPPTTTQPPTMPPLEAMSDSWPSPAYDNGNTRWLPYDLPENLSMQWEKGVTFSNSGVVVDHGHAYYEAMANLQGVNSYYLICADMATGETLWAYDINGGYASEWHPVLADGKVFLLDYEGSAEGYASFFILCIDARYGTLLWQSGDTFVDSAEASIYAQNGKLYMVNGDIDDGTGMIYCFNASSGSLTWSTPLIGYPWASMAIDGNNIFVSTNAGFDDWDLWAILYCIDASTGGIKWHREVGQHLRNAPLAVNGKVYVSVGGPTDYEGEYEHIICFNQQNGNMVWDAELADSWINGESELSSNGDAVIVSYLGVNANWLSSFDAQDGSRNWSTQLQTSDIYDVSLSNSVAYIVVGSRSANGVRYAEAINGYDIQTGVSLFSVPTAEEYQFQALTLAGSRLFMVTMGKIYSYG